MKIGTPTIAALGADSIGAAFAFAAPPTKTGFDAEIAHNAQEMLDEGKKTFRFETFGSEAFWGEALQLHNAIIYFNEVDNGGHFAAWERPELFSTELQASDRAANCR
jgi:hypothetical protein